MKIGVCPKAQQQSQPSTLATFLNHGEWGVTASGAIVHRFKEGYNYIAEGGMKVHGIFITPYDTWLIRNDAVIDGPITITHPPVVLK